MTGHDKESEKKLKARRDNATFFCTILYGCTDGKCSFSRRKIKLWCSEIITEK